MSKNKPECVEYSNGAKEWYLNGLLHREDGPAHEGAIGSKYWYQNGQRHREDGPAVEYPGGSKYWYQNDKLHRATGPACEEVNHDSSITHRWFFFGILMGEYKTDKFWNDQ